ncbi:MAG: hypothetical protein [Caudoviricetes sp.]|nr:MAG: hypothetical protein [Caudoviricetes sp.]
MGDTMKTQANKLFMFREMSDSITVEIAQQPHTTRSPIAVSGLVFSKSDNSNSVKVLIKKTGHNNVITISETTNGTEAITVPESSPIPQGELSGVLSSYVSDFFSLI